MSDPYYTSGAGLTLESLNRAIQEVRDEVERPVDRSRSQAIVARLPEFWYSRSTPLDAEEVEFMVVVLRTIDEVILHPRTARLISDEIERIIAKANE